MVVYTHVLIFFSSHTHAIHVLATNTALKDQQTQFWHPLAFDVLRHKHARIYIWCQHYCAFSFDHATVHLVCKVTTSFSSSTPHSLSSTMLSPQQEHFTSTACVVTRRTYVWDSKNPASLNSTSLCRSRAKHLYFARVFPSFSVPYFTISECTLFWCGWQMRLTKVGDGRYSLTWEMLHSWWSDVIVPFCAHGSLPSSSFSATNSLDIEVRAVINLFAALRNFFIT